MAMMFARIASASGLGLWLSFVQVPAQAEIQCVADFSPSFVLGKVTVEISDTGSSRLTVKMRGPTSPAWIDTELTMPSIKVRDEHVRHDLHLGTKHSPEEYLNLNYAERFLVRLQSGLESATLQPNFKIPFRPKDVYRIKTYDLQGNSDESKFGGVELFEAYSADGTLLGRVVQILFTAGCY
jgi:hypothetical protein